MPDYLPFLALFASDGMGYSTQFVEVVPDEFTVRRHPRFRTNGLRPDMWYDTPICEVELLPCERAWPAEVWRLLRERGLCKQIGDAEFARRVFGTLLDIIKDVWEPDKFHLVLHSAGYDSRLLSLAIRELHRKHGPEWLGRVLFIEVLGEGPWFQRVMEIEGWPPECWVVKGAYHELSFDFGTAWARMGAGTWAWPINPWWDTIVWGQRRGIVPETDRLQCWSAQGANYVGKGTLGFGGLDLREVMRVAYHRIYGALPMFCDWIFPYMDYRYVRVLRAVGGGRHGKGYIQEVLHEIEPRLEVIGNPNPMDTVPLGVPDEIFNQAMRDYRDSWYGGEVTPSVPFTPVANFEPCWGFYALASYCEHALAEGRRIHVS